MFLPGWLQNFLDWIALPASALLAGLMFRRRLHRELPLFFSYILANIFIGVARFIALKLSSPETYFYFYWASDVLIGIFELLVFYEVFLRRLFARFYEIRFYRVLFVIAAAGVVFLTIASGMVASKSYLLVASHAFDFSRALILCFFTALTLFMGRDWGTQEFGIALGFGMFSATSVTISAIWAKAHFQHSAIKQIYVITYDIACAIWLFYFSRPRRNSLQVTTSASLDSEAVHRAKEAERELKSWVIGKKSSE